VSNSKQTMGVVAVVLAVVVGLAMYSANVFQERTKFVPAKIFEAAFDEPVSRAENMIGVKDDSYQYDVYLKFKYPHKPIHKFQSEFKKAWNLEARNWFNEKFPDDEGLKKLDHLDFCSRQKNDPTLVTNEWILYNKLTDDVYYRIFGTSR